MTEFTAGQRIFRSAEKRGPGAGLEILPRGKASALPPSSGHKAASADRPLYALAQFRSAPAAALRMVKAIA